jgi:23S rRNA pseudouridine2457 synthase
MSQFSSSGDKRTLSEFNIPDKDVYPVGRLDHDSEGLMILSNDKVLIHKLTSHNVSHNRTYIVQLDGDIDSSAIQKLENGLKIAVDGKSYRTKSCKSEIIESPSDLWERNPPVRFRATIPTSWIKIILSEGKNRQIRKMTASVGFPTLRLIRVAIENLSIGKLSPGEFIKMEKSDIYKKLKILV